MSLYGTRSGHPENRNKTFSAWRTSKTNQSTDLIMLDNVQNIFLELISRLGTILHAVVQMHLCTLLCFKEILV